MGGEAERPAQGVGEGEDAQRSAEGDVARDGEGAGVAEGDEADFDIDVHVAEGERTSRGEGAVPEFDPLTCQRTVDWERSYGRKPVPPETTCTPGSLRSAGPETVCTPGSLKRKDGVTTFCHQGREEAAAAEARQLVLDVPASGDLERVGVHSRAPMMEERERRAKEHGAAGAGGVEGIQGMAEEAGGVVEMRLSSTLEERPGGGDRAQVGVDEQGGDLEEVGVHSGAPLMEERVRRAKEHGAAGAGEVEREATVARVHDGEQVERVEVVAGVHDGDAQVEMEEDVVRADAAALVGAEGGMAGGDFTNGRGEGEDHLDPIVHRFIDDEMGPALAGLTSGSRRALGALPLGDREAFGLGMGDFMHMSLGGPPSLVTRRERIRCMPWRPQVTLQRRSSMHLQDGPGERDTRLSSGARRYEQPREERGDAPATDITGAHRSLVRFTGLQLMTTSRPVRPCVQGFGLGVAASIEVPPVRVVDLGSEPTLRTSQEDTDHSRPLMPPPPPRSRYSDPPSTPVRPPPHSPSTPAKPRVCDTTAVGSLPLDTSLFRSMNIDLDSTRRVTVHTARRQPGLGGADTGRGAPREVMAAVSQPRHVRGGGEAGSTFQAALAAAACAVRDQTARKSGVAHPRPMPVAGGAALGESSGAVGLGMPRGSRCEKTVAEVTQVSARVVRVRTGTDPMTVVEDDPETEPECEEAPQEDDEYRDDEESEEEESDNSEDDCYDDDDEPSPPRQRGSRRQRRSCLSYVVAMGADGSALRSEAGTS
ncbi:hypothetical protein CBR_g26225 [Chara braunii]|uniref:Uncharacterized protein n=1 Tax=Chara braunii TaxID=69332 RepID=A0A388L7H6_CHABU|nr:hypothetical protein CBR_g26225 [Chara braunii]|eukprot:GBG78192.1 hypothetical protein CBR_g26225 [Chara braunii]